MTNPIKLILAGNNRNGYRVLEWLLGRGENIIAVVLHPDDRAQYKHEMKRVLPADVPVIEGNRVNSPEVVQQLSDLKPTGKTLQEKLEVAALELFSRSWESLKTGELEPIAAADQGSSHVIKDVVAIDRIDLERQYKARDLINILRARTYPPYRNAYIECDGRKYYLQIEIIPESPASGDVNDANH